MGYRRVRVLAGGWGEWLRMSAIDPDGYPLER
jgi:hypothetical protein